MPATITFSIIVTVDDSFSMIEDIHVDLSQSTVHWDGIPATSEVKQFSASHFETHNKIVKAFIAYKLGNRSHISYLTNIWKRQHKDDKLCNKNVRKLFGSNGGTSSRFVELFQLRPNQMLLVNSSLISQDSIVVFLSDSASGSRCSASYDALVAIVEGIDTRSGKFQRQILPCPIVLEHKCAALTSEQAPITKTPVESLLPIEPHTPNDETALKSLINSDNSSRQGARNKRPRLRRMRMEIDAPPECANNPAVSEFFQRCRAAMSALASDLPPDFTFTFREYGPTNSIFADIEIDERAIPGLLMGLSTGMLQQFGLYSVGVILPRSLLKRILFPRSRFDYEDDISQRLLRQFRRMLTQHDKIIFGLPTRHHVLTVSVIPLSDKLAGVLAAILNQAVTQHFVCEITSTMSPEQSKLCDLWWRKAFADSGGTLRPLKSRTREEQCAGQEQSESAKTPTYFHE